MEYYEWYWVRMKDSNFWFPATYSISHGWTRLDYWEDWDNEVVEYIKIPGPDKLQQ